MKFEEVMTINEYIEKVLPISRQAVKKSVKEGKLYLLPKVRAVKQSGKVWLLWVK